MKEIIGLEINRIFVGEGEHDLYVDTNAGVLHFGTFADCCSETWVADILGVDALLGATVMFVDELDLPDPQDGRSRQQEDIIYGYGLTTNKGRATIAFRNSSNGYYGGHVEPAVMPDDVPDNAREITDDWGA